MPTGTIPESVAPLVPLFAPYCGGVGRLLPLEGALAILLAGDWTGKRLLQGGRCHMLRLYVFAISAYLAIWSASRTYCRARIKGLGFRVGGLGILRHLVRIPK